MIHKDFQNKVPFLNYLFRTLYFYLFYITLSCSVYIYYNIVEGDKVKANEGSLVSISQESEPWLRSNLLAHEGFHTIFFRDAEFRNYVSAVYYTMDPVSRDFLIDYFKSQEDLGYDTNDSYLMNNEFMA